MLAQQQRTSTRTTPFGSLSFVEDSLCLRSPFSLGRSILHTLEEVRVPKLAHLVDIDGLDDLLIVEQNPGGLVELLADECHIMTVIQSQSHLEQIITNESMRQTTYPA